MVYIVPLNGPASNTDYKGLDRMCMEMEKYLNALKILHQPVEQIETRADNCLRNRWDLHRRTCGCCDMSNLVVSMRSEGTPGDRRHRWKRVREPTS